MKITRRLSGDAPCCTELVQVAAKWILESLSFDLVVVIVKILRMMRHGPLLLDIMTDFFKAFIKIKDDFLLC